MSAEQKLACIDEKLGRLLGLTEPLLSRNAQAGVGQVAQLRTDREPAKHNFEAELGRAAQSFTLTNLGNTAAITFKTSKLQAEVASNVGPFYMLPHTTRTFTRTTEIVEVKPAGDGAVWLQVDAL